MPESVPTVKVKSNNEQGFVVINESDFDSSKHELLEAKKQPVLLAQDDQDEPKRRGRPPLNK